MGTVSVVVLMPALSPRELPSIGRDLYALVEEQASRWMPNWRELLPPGAFDQA